MAVNRMAYVRISALDEWLSSIEQVGLPVRSSFWERILV